MQKREIKSIESVLSLVKIKTEVSLFGSRIKGKCDKSA